MGRGGVVSVHHKVRSVFQFGSGVGYGPGKVIPDPTDSKVPNWTAVRIRNTVPLHGVCVHSVVG